MLFEGLLFFVSFAWLIAAHVAFFFTSNQPVFVRPFSIVLLFSFLKTVPYSALSYFYPTVVRDDIVSYMTTDNLPWVIVVFNFLYGLFIISAGFFYKISGGVQAEILFFKEASSLLLKAKFSQINLFVFGFLSFVLFYIKLDAIGGLENTVLGVDLDRGGATIGIGYILSLADLSLAFLSLFALINFYKNRSVASAVIFIAVLLSCVFSFSLLGGRKALLQHLIILCGFWIILGGRIKLLSLPSAIIAVFALLYFMVLLEMRLTEGERDVLFNFAQFGIFQPVVKFFVNFSYNEIYYFIIYHFSEAKVFWGRVFADLIYSPLPASVFQNKPPVDEGVYVKALIVGLDVVPGTPATEFRGLGSMPPETFGNAIMNFGLFSVLFFGPIYGFLASKLVCALVNKKFFGVFSIYFVYQFFINFQLSNLRVVTLLTVLGVCVLYWVVFLLVNFTAAPRIKSL